MDYRGVEYRREKEEGYHKINRIPTTEGNPDVFTVDGRDVVVL